MHRRPLWYRTDNRESKHSSGFSTFRELFCVSQAPESSDRVPVDAHPLMSHSNLSHDPPPHTTDELDERITRPSDAVVQAIAECDGDFAVLGAAGKMGYHVSRMLTRALDRLGRSDRVLTVSRFSDPPARQRFEAAGFTTIAADLSDPDQVVQVPLARNVIYLAGVKFGTSTAPDLLDRMNVQMPRLIAERFRDARTVALSTGCVYSFVTPESGGSTEQDPTDPPGDYARSCLGREHAFVEGSKRHGTPCALVRLNYSIDLRYGVLVDLAQKVMAGEPIDVTTGYVNVIWQGDAVAQILQCFSVLGSPPRIINVTGTEVLPVRDLAKRFAERLGVAVSFHGQEAPTAWLSNSGRAEQWFGPPQVGVDQMIDWIAQWLTDGGATYSKPTHFENRSGQY